MAELFLYPHVSFVLDLLKECTLERDSAKLYPEKLFLNLRNKIQRFEIVLKVTMMK